MIRIIFVIAATSLLVSSQEQIKISSSDLYKNSPSVNLAFTTIGQYSGRTDEGKSYKKTYYISKYFRSIWAEAKAICKAFDLELATFETLHEAESFFKKQAEADHFPPYASNPRHSNYAHIDGMTTKLGSSSDWYWTNSGLKIPYTMSWAPGQPNNAFGEEPCLSVERKDGKFAFNDYSCSQFPTSFICQKTELVFD